MHIFCPKKSGKKGGPFRVVLGSFFRSFWSPKQHFGESSEKVFFDQKGVLFEGSRFRGRFIVKNRLGRSEKRYCCNSWKVFSRCFLLVKNLVF